MTKYSEQIQRIKDKLIIAKKADKNFKVFGAKSHHYSLGKPATGTEIAEVEKKYNIQIPDCYKAFITQVGNGGKSYADAAAGPFYGIYPLGKHIDELIYDNTEKYLNNTCILYPKMSDVFWKSLTKGIDEKDNLSDEDYENESGKIYAGILPIGSQGCAYLHGIILTGQHIGRVVNVDIDRQKPQFAFENNFLDWYERWLDEVISGELIRDNPSWFGYTKGGSEQELLASYMSPVDLEDKKDSLEGLLNKNRLTNQTIHQIENLIIENAEAKNTLIQLLCKSDYEKAKPHLMELLKTDLLSVFQFIFWYAKSKSGEWLKTIEDNIQRIDDAETFRFCTYVLKETNADYGRIIVPFTKNIQEDIRVQAFFTLGQLKNKKDYIEVFAEGLKDDSNRVIHTTLQALSGVKDKRLLEQYKHIAEKFPVERDHILVNLNHLLAEYGLTNKAILNKRGGEQQNKRWYELWK